MKFTLKKIDHVHVFVSDRESAVKWYSEVLGLVPIKELLFWSVNGGPLTVGNEGIHLALFKGDQKNKSVIAFSVSGEDFELIKVHLKNKAVVYKFMDHDISLSIYFSDPYGNEYEVTTYS